MNEVVELAAHMVPADLYVQCPLKRFIQRQVRSACLGCPHLGGFLHVADNDRAPWQDQYRVVCGCPIHRQMIQIEVPDARAV